MRQLAGRYGDGIAGYDLGPLRPPRHVARARGPPQAPRASRHVRSPNGRGMAVDLLCQAIFLSIILIDFVIHQMPSFLGSRSAVFCTRRWSIWNIIPGRVVR